MDSARRAKKRGNSLVLRLTVNQIWRTVRTLFLFDIMVAVLFSGAIFVHVSVQGAKLLPLLLENEGDVSLLEQALNCQVWEDSELQGGMVLPVQVSEYTGLPRQTVVSVHARGIPWNPIWNTGEMWCLFSVATGEPGQYLHLRLDISLPVSLASAGLILLSAVQVLLVLMGIFSVRRTVVRILQPINDLAMTARTINTMPAAQPALRLSGAIDTLNAIDEMRLDTRISIDDEREELRGLAAAINNMLDRLDAAYHAQLRFVSDASHELRTPIAVIRGYASLLDRWGKKDAKTLQESIDAIKSEAQGMEKLVEQLLFLARSDNDTIAVELQSVNLPSLVDEVARETRMIRAGHEIRTDLEDVPAVMADEKLLKQALRVFVDNAVKYTPEGGRVTIGVGGDRENVRISVTDTGIGISDEDLPHVFDRFFRADESRTRTTGGTGLGLAIARSIVERHGGHIELLSRKEFGTRITAVLPCRVAHTATGNENPPQAV